MSCCHQFKISLCSRHIPGCLYVIADSLSRLTQIQSTEWSLQPHVFEKLCQKWLTYQVDLFATRLNHKVPLYVSPVTDHQALNIDVLNISWPGFVACIHIISNSSAAQSRTKHLPVQQFHHTDSLRLTSHALCLGSSPTINKDFTPTANITNTAQTATKCFTKTHSV